MLNINLEILPKLGDELTYCIYTWTILTSVIYDTMITDD